jgi:hypothetical protein
VAWVRGSSFFVLILFQSFPGFLFPLYSVFLDGACMLTYKLFSYAGMGMMPGMGRGAFNNMTGMGSGFGMQGHFNPAFMQGGGVPAAVGGQGGSFPPDGPRKRFRVDESR